MWINLLWTLLILAAAVLLIWLAVRLVRGQHGWWRWVAAVALGIVAVVLLVVTGVLGRGMAKAYMPRSFAVQDIKAPTDADSIARGEHIAESTCQACHSPNNELPLSGGRNLALDAGLPLGDIYPPNLTPAGEIATWSDGQVLRAIRQGTHASNRPLAMPVTRLSNLSDEDALAVIAYLRSQPAVQSEAHKTRFSLLTIAFLGLGMLNVDAHEITQPIVAPPKGPTAEYGAYLVSFKDCRDCHGEKLDGHPAGPLPPGPPLYHIRGWTSDMFINTLRTGVNPSGQKLKSTMPWQTYGKMDDQELTAVWEYLKTIPMPGQQQ